MIELWTTRSPRLRGPCRHGEYPSIDGRNGARQAARSLIWADELGEYREVDRPTGRIIQVVAVSREDKRQTATTRKIGALSRWADDSAAVADAEKPSRWGGSATTGGSRWGSKADTGERSKSRWNR